MLYFSTWTASTCWANVEQMASTRWTEFGERLWTMNDEWTQSAESKLERKVNGKHIVNQYVNARWTIYTESLESYSYIVFHR